MIALITLFALASAAPEEDFDPARVDVVDALTCRLDAPEYNGFAIAVMSDGLADKRGWRPADSGTPFLREYDLPAPITLAGHYATRRIGFSSGGVVAMLDEPDPAKIAREEGIVNALDPEPVIQYIVASGKATREQVEAAIPFRKFMGEKLVADRKELPKAGESFGAHTTIAHSIANATTHPGKTLYGCSYQIELIGKDGKPL